MHRALILAALLVLAAAIAACGSDDEAAPTPAPEADATAQPDPTPPADDAPEPEETPSANGDDPAARATDQLPDNYPVPPGAEFRRDQPESGNAHRWIFDTQATGTEVCEFYAAAYEDMGFSVSTSPDCASISERTSFWEIVGRGDGRQTVTRAQGSGEPRERGFSIIVFWDDWGD